MVVVMAASDAQFKKFTQGDAEHVRATSTEQLRGLSKDTRIVALEGYGIGTHFEVVEFIKNRFNNIMFLGDHEWLTN